ncbi:MAG: phosphoribosylformylglycinamidine cyclo-ligase [Desulfosarcina sp.]|nr:phosphoribosylformylglycinamidine cyclo-ligase [Desulfobacterales bacterium]
MAEELTYAGAGVDIDKANRLVDRIKDIAKSTPRSGVMGEIGGFGGLFALNLAQIEKPVLVSSTDGVGTKLKIAFLTGCHDTVGIDLVAMSVNDICVQGARPLFFLDYFSVGRLDEDVAETIIRGVAEGCRQAGCALIGGETAEMPGFYAEGEYDLAGFAVGIVDNSKIIDGSGTQIGDKLIGIASSGLHSNGYSLARKIIFDVLKLGVDDEVPELGRTVGEELLMPTRIYAVTIEGLRRTFEIHGLAHVTGGGIPENVIRVIPTSCGLRMFEGSWEVPPIFPFLQAAGRESDYEMKRTFNNGIGMIAVVPEKESGEVLDRLTGMEEKAFLVGEVIKRPEDAERILWIDSDEFKICR